ncbi:MAG: ABC transporter ATP-binding protein [Sarcina sp.]
MLKVNRLSAGYNKKNIIEDISFQGLEGEFLAIVGPNGSGKSTVLKSLGKLLDYDGEVLIDGINIKGIKGKEFAKKVGFMNQHSENFFPYTVYDTVSLGRYPYLEGSFSTLNKKDKELVLNAIEKVGLLNYKDKYITELSGGELQRVYLAKIFVQDPKIILLDEPTNHLDLKYQIEILTYIKIWAKENKKLVIAVLHDLNLVQYFSEKVILIGNGTLKLIGDKEKVLKSKELEEIYQFKVKDFMMEITKNWG